MYLLFFRLALVVAATIQLPIQLIGFPIKVPTEPYKGHDVWGNHPGHYPYVSNLTFRTICDHVIDSGTATFDPDVVRQGDLVYVNIWYLDWFAKVVHDQIRYPYLLFSGDVGNWVPDPPIKKLLYDPKLAAWFCRNIVFSYHPKIIQTPIGQDLAQWVLDTKAIDDLKNTEAKRPFQKKHLLYMNHYPRTHGGRDTLVKLFENEPYCYSRNHSDKPYEMITRNEYYEDLSHSYFVLSPVGYETDSVRTWEALALDCIPIVEHTFLDPIYEGLPVVIVHDWNEIDQPFLEKKYEELKGLKCDKAYFDYWKRLICETQLKVKNDDRSFSYLDATEFSQTDLKDLRSIISDETVLIYKGFLSSIRPLQLIKFCPFISHIYLYDPWLDKATFENFCFYLNDEFYLKGKEKISIIDVDLSYRRTRENFDRLIDKTPNPYAVFLDLTYYRNSLLNDFSNDLRIFRFNLKRDLKNLYKQLPIFTLLCGNQIHDPYVKETLEFLSEELDLNIESKGAFWYVVKQE